MKNKIIIISVIILLVVCGVSGVILKIRNDHVINFNKFVENIKGNISTYTIDEFEEVYEDYIEDCETAIENKEIKRFNFLKEKGRILLEKSTIEEESGKDLETESTKQEENITDFNVDKAFEYLCSNKMFSYINENKLVEKKEGSFLLVQYKEGIPEEDMYKLLVSISKADDFTLNEMKAYSFEVRILYPESSGGLGKEIILEKGHICEDGNIIIKKKDKLRVKKDY